MPNGQDYKATGQMVVRDFETRFNISHLRKQGGNVAATAREIGVHPVSLCQKLSALGICTQAPQREQAKV